MAKIRLVLVYFVLGLGVSRASMEQDEQDCADEMQNLVSCVPFVSGSAKKPTQQCCDDTAKVRSSKPKCLCVLIKESTDPSLALPINTTLALQMPSACNIDAKVSDCPAILKLPPNSPDAKIFKDAAGDSTSRNITSTATPSSVSSSSASPSSSSYKSSDSKATPSSSEGSALETFSGGSFSLFLASMALVLA